MLENGILALDVDGVLNPYAAKPWRRPAGYLTMRVRPDGWPVHRKPLRLWLNPDHGPMLWSLAQAHGLELVWASTWQHEANTYISPMIGLPTLPVIEFSHLDKPEWKYPEIAAYAHGRPLMWLDDDFNSQARYGRKVFDAERGDLSTLLHPVNPAVGLLSLDIEAIKKWIDTQ